MLSLVPRPPINTAGGKGVGGRSGNETTMFLVSQNQTLSDCFRDSAQILVTWSPTLLWGGGAETGNEAIVLVVMERNVHCTVQLGIDQNVWCKVLGIDNWEIFAVKIFSLVHGVAKIKRMKYYTLCCRTVEGQNIFNAKI